MQVLPYLHFDGAACDGRGLLYFDDTPIPQSDDAEGNQVAAVAPTPAYPDGTMACTQDQYDNAGPWTTLAAGAIVIGTPPGPTLAEQAAALLAGGLTIASTATPALNGTYACDSATTQNIQAEIIAIMLNSTFADGGTTVEWPDTAGALHSFDIAAFKAFAATIAAFVAVATRISLSNAGTLPSATATIP